MFSGNGNQMSYDSRCNTVAAIRFSDIYVHNIRASSAGVVRRGKLVLETNRTTSRPGAINIGNEGDMTAIGDCRLIILTVGNHQHVISLHSENGMYHFLTPFQQFGDILTFSYPYHCISPVFSTTGKAL